MGEKEEEEFARTHQIPRWDRVVVERLVSAIGKLEARDQQEENIRLLMDGVRRSVADLLVEIRRIEQPPKIVLKKPTWLSELVYSAGLTGGGMFIGFGIDSLDKPLIICGVCLLVMTLFRKRE